MKLSPYSKVIPFHFIWPDTTLRVSERETRREREKEVIYSSLYSADYHNMENCNHCVCVFVAKAKERKVKLMIVGVKLKSMDS